LLPIQATVTITVVLLPENEATGVVRLRLHLNDNLVNQHNQVY
jgi:predicted acetyltransferase